MLQVGRYSFKRAETDDDFEQIHRLNYRTFVEELGQHPPTGGGRLVDKFHEKNVYFVALTAGQAVGMISAHDQAPFSIADRLVEPALLDRPGIKPLEVRLLAVEHEHRAGLVLAGLLWSMFEFANRRYTDVFISGVVERAGMYERLGFRALGPAVRCGMAEFIPMSLKLPVEPRIERLAQWWLSRV
jgi:predicted N-acetyltransferase YhbS